MIEVYYGTPIGLVAFSTLQPEVSREAHHLLSVFERGRVPNETFD